MPNQRVGLCPRGTEQLSKADDDPGKRGMESDEAGRAAFLISHT